MSARSGDWGTTTRTKKRVVVLVDQGHDAQVIAEMLEVSIQSVYYHLRTCPCHNGGHPTPRMLAREKTRERLAVRRAYQKRKEFGSTWVRCRSCGRRGRTNVKIVGRRHVIEKCGECKKMDGEL